MSVIYADDYIKLANKKWPPIYSGRKLEVKNWLVAKKSLAVAALWRWLVIRGHLYRKCIWNSKWWPLSGGGCSNWWPVKTSYTVYLLYYGALIGCPDVCCVVLSEAVDWRDCFTQKIQHGGDWERSWPQGLKNVHNFLMTMRPLSWACGHGTEMLLI